MLMDLLEIVANRPTTEKRDDPPTCPFCKGQGIREAGTTSTLVGYIGEDYNHTWTQCTCISCGEVFVRETKGPQCVWYTQHKKVIKGVPGCFESYIYQCAKCNGPVQRKYTNLEGKETQTLTTLNVDGKMVKQYRSFYFCDLCGHGGEVEYDYLNSQEK